MVLFFPKTAKKKRRFTNPSTEKDSKQRIRCSTSNMASQLLPSTRRRRQPSTRSAAWQAETALNPQEGFFFELFWGSKASRLTGKNWEKVTFCVIENVISWRFSPLESPGLLPLGINSKKNPVCWGPARSYTIK